MKKLILFICLLTISVSMVSCVSEQTDSKSNGFEERRRKTLYGEFMDIEGDISAAYIKDYLMMDCCEEWSILVPFVKNIKGISSAEAFEFYLYDEDGAETDPESMMTVTFRPSDEFNDREGEIAIYKFPEGNVYACDTEAGQIRFYTDIAGIYVATRYGSAEEPWISNQECTGQCKTCSEEW